MRIDPGLTPRIDPNERTHRHLQAMGVRTLDEVEGHAHTVTSDIGSAESRVSRLVFELAREVSDLDAKRAYRDSLATYLKWRRAAEGES